MMTKSEIDAIFGYVYAHLLTEARMGHFYAHLPHREVWGEMSDYERVRAQAYDTMLRVCGKDTAEYVSALGDMWEGG